MKRMIQTIQAFLIHLLGGATTAEQKESNTASYEIDKYVMLTSIRTFAKSLYGQEPHIWAEMLYQKLEHDIQEMEANGKELE